MTRVRKTPSNADLAKWHEIKHDLLDHLYTGVTGRFQIAGHRQIAKWSERFKDEIVVEVGCGHGHQLAHGSVAYRQYVGLDIEYEFLRMIQSRHSNSRTVNGDAYHLPFGDSTVDCVISVYTLEHLRQLSQGLAEVKRVLGHGGEFLVGLPAEGGKLYGAGRWLTSRRFMQRKYGIDYMTIVHWEHWNTCAEVIYSMEEYFKIIEKTFIPFGFAQLIDVNAIVCLRAVPK